MEFLNESVDIQGLPKVEELKMNPLEHDYLKVIRIEWAISSLVLMLICLALVTFIPALRQIRWISVIGAGWLILVGTYAFLQTKSFHRRAYAFRQKDVVYRSGWLIETIRTCPFNRIQHSSVSISLLEKRFGLGTLSLYTAGSDGADLRIPGLKEHEAHRIKEWITERISDEPQQLP